ncbi:hypothetical protein DNI29_10750 [Hymenobacter sediminis]|uniref:AAA family ATPase n=1 Tax=Hymenobacter sediminis TaxID=2218621 RepID=UPI000DA6C396|nr:ATP-binding protein [Hymenobacter sediminis]RPD47906.1 hypothetical protein DNI29_10750 [Hymenobacter sediminis]
MINSLEVKNYRSLKNLLVPSFGRVNLITGKNNSGKSTLLEAISILSSKGDIQWIYGLLTERGENYNSARKDSTVDNYIRSLSSLFYNRDIDYSKDGLIWISELEPGLFGLQGVSSNTVSMRFVRYANEFIQADNLVDERVALRSKRVIIEEPDLYVGNAGEFGIGFEIKVGQDTRLLTLDDERLFERLRFGARTQMYSSNFQYIRTRNIDKEVNGKLWDNVALTEKEAFVIDALRVIEPKLERIAFIGSDEYGGRTTVVKIKDSSKVLPLRSMGDGINRVLTIILALVNSDNGYLFIDEFENGLHYSVQEKIWGIIFEVARKLKIQVFATTHSEDCIKAFGSIFQRQDYYKDRKLIRLEGEDGSIRVVDFDSNELSVIADQDIDPR